MRYLGRSGNHPWELTVPLQGGGRASFAYNTMDDALIDYIFRMTGVDGDSTHGASPRRYRSTYGRIFHPLEHVEHLISFHDSIPEALAEIQSGEQFCRNNPDHFTMQGTGIHRYDKSLGRYMMSYTSPDLSGLLREVARKMSNTGETYDLFISHASEDRNDIVRPLAEALYDLGLSVWYDEFTLRPGDSIRESLDRGIVTSRNGLVVISPAFIAKQWTQWELNGIIGRLMSGQVKMLPLWHGIDREAVSSFSPSIADVVAIIASGKTIGELAGEVVAALREP